MARKYTSPYLSDYRGKKLNVRCRQCGSWKHYEVDALLAKVGDHCMPEFRMDIARALKRPNVENVYKNVCLIGSDHELGQPGCLHPATPS